MENSHTPQVIYQVPTETSETLGGFPKRSTQGGNIEMEVSPSSGAKDVGKALLKSQDIQKHQSKTVPSPQEVWLDVYTEMTMVF